MNCWWYGAIFLTGIGAGFLNVVAGGGSLLTLPLLDAFGLPVGMANATNRVAILLQNLVAIQRFRAKGVLDFREVLPLILPAMAGSVGGTLVAIEMDQQVLRLVIAGIITFMAFLLVFRPHMWEEGREKPWPRWAVGLLFFCIGAYGGFIQAGVGFFLIWALVGVMGNDLVHANAVKVTLVASYTVLSLGLFFSRGMVDLSVGIALALGNMLGAVLGARFTVMKGNRALRYILVGAILLSAGKMLYSALFS
ncbi:MAG TPA: sulfite exporter TauE/SafE family protein [Synergistaceae bacterium]|nr:sulfite exporter TauE/SafE family protein [Synergistaceae bacterium]HPJ24554.1 sulfite exporter TauE/SafE family protein [Synergistaceae bacterium]HPQ36311.1 sulfite exporter TauE/SafE family protein [Synergistaceae bacterium]